MFLSVGKLGNVFAINIGSHAMFVADLAVLRMPNREIYFSRNIGNISQTSIRETLFPQKNLNLCGNIFAFREAKFCFCNYVCRGGQTAKHHTKHNVSTQHKKENISLHTPFNS